MEKINKEKNTIGAEARVNKVFCGAGVKDMKEKNTIGAEALANNRTQAGTRLREVRVRFWRGSNC